MGTKFDLGEIIRPRKFEHEHLFQYNPKFYTWQWTLTLTKALAIIILHLAIESDIYNVTKALTVV